MSHKDIVQLWKSIPTLASLSSTQAAIIRSKWLPQVDLPPFEIKWVGCTPLGVCLSLARKPISQCLLAVDNVAYTAVSLSYTHIRILSSGSCCVKEQNKDLSVWVCGITLAAPSATSFPVTISLRERTTLYLNK